MNRKIAVSALFLVVLCVQVFIVDSWFRRRRRRNPIPPPQNCQVSSWSSYSSCSHICSTGSQTRTRQVTVSESWGGTCPYNLQETRSCGSPNNGCSGPGSSCDPSNGNCKCSSGYHLASAKQCEDTNECEQNNGKGPCDQVCSNSLGSYTCSCNAGYTLSGSHECTPLDCHAFTLPSCPTNAYQDEFSNVCKKVQFSCPSGTNYLQYCTLSCLNGYGLANITYVPGKAFGQDFQKVDFSSVKSTISCVLQKGGNGVHWDVGQNLGSYYCRRTNDPPYEITLNGTTLQEHAASGTVIGSLSSKDYQQGQTFTYTVLSPSMLFTCQGQSLKSTWNDPQLHGAIPLLNGTIEVTIRSTDNGLPQMWKEKTFTIEIQNVNDPPVNITLSNLKVFENINVSSIVGVLSAVDGDDPPNTQPSSDFTWTLIDSINGKFNLSGANLTVAQALNHEAEKIHQIKVRCTDKGTPPESSERTFVISVLDINEPVALTLSSSSVLENSPNGTVVGVLKAVDQESDAVTFNISQSNDATLRKFTLGPTSHSMIGSSTIYQADVEVKDNLDYESRNAYQIVVQASDKSGQVLQDWTISVINVNEKPVEVNLTGSHTVDENSLAGTIVGHFVVTDPDNINSITQTHFCSLENSQSDANNYLIISSGTVLKVKGGDNIIDYETMKELSITVRCTDTGTPSMFIVRSFNITVQDINEQPTSLTLSNQTIPENSPIGTVLGTLSSNDPESLYQSYNYSIIGPDGTPFIIGGLNNTAIILNGSLDYEKTPSLNLVVRVTDNGGLFKEETLKVDLIDMNDPPTDIKLPGIGGELGLRENSGENVIISEITLVDQDEDTPRCTLVEDAGGRVKLLALKHLVVGATKTDYESSVHKELNITLNCSDGHNVFISKSFNIMVLDVNELITNIKVSYLSIPENQANAVVGIITVNDPDVGQSHVCSVCEVVQGDSCSSYQYFIVNAALELKTKQALNFEAKHVHNIVINCSDIVSDSQKSLSKEKSFSVTVKDVNEQPSSLCQSPFQMSIDASNGAIIALLQGIDPDNEGSASNKQALFYSTNDVISDLPFKLNDNRLFKYKDISEEHNYTIDIKVTDDGRVVTGFSSNGYLYSMKGSLSKVFTCHVIASKSTPSSIVNLNPNNVSIMAPDGTVIGTLTSKLVESLTYRLVEEETIPFAIEGNELKVKQKNIQDYTDYGNRRDLFFYMEIETVGQVSGTIRSGLYVHVNNNAPLVPMCLVKSSIGENMPLQTIAGQLLIEDTDPPKYPCSMTSCCSQVENITANTFPYQCRINNPRDSSIISSNNATNMFYIDERYLLRSKMIFNHSEGSIELRISCHDLTLPLHIIGKNFTVNILECSTDGQCPPPPECGHCYNNGKCQDQKGSYTCLCNQGFTGSNCATDIDYCAPNPCKNSGKCKDIVTTFECSCVTEYSGMLCDRNIDLCNSCSSDTLCAKFTDAGMRCLSEEYQVPILVDGQNLTEQELWEIENEISELVDQNKDELRNKTDARRKRRSTSTFYVETLQIEALADKSLLRFVIMDSRDDYNPLLAKDACALLAETSRHCVNEDDCAVIIESGNSCPVIGGILGQSAESSQVSGLSGGGYAGVALCVIFVVFAVLIGAVYYYRKKYRQSKQDERPVVNYNSGEATIEFTNPSFNNDTASAEVLQEMARDRIAKENLVGINLDLTSVKKRNDIKVTENELYCAPGRDSPSGTSTQNPLYISGAVSRNPNNVNMDEEKPKNVNAKKGGDMKPGNEPMYEDLDAVKNKNMKMVVGPEDLKKEKMKVQLNSAREADASNRYDEWDPKIHGKAGKNKKKQNKNEVPEDIRPISEDNPIEFNTRSMRNQYENVCHLSQINPIYDNSPVESVRGAENHIYENVTFGQSEEVISSSSIVNPVYEQSMDFDEGTGDLEDPLYEVIHVKEKPPVEEKSRRRSFLRSVSSEKAGYEEINDEECDEKEEEQEQEDETMGNSKA